MKKIEKRNLAMKAFNWALRIDKSAAKTDVAALRAKYPGKSRRQLAEHLVKRARWWATGSGMATGLPSNPFAAAPAAIVDAGAVLRTEVILATRIGLLYSDRFLDGDDPPYEILIPIFGAHKLSAALGKTAVTGGKQLTKNVIRKYLSKETLKAVKKIALKRFGVKVTQKAILTKSIPVVGGLIGGGWNFSELTFIGNRTIRYFEAAA